MKIVEILVRSLLENPLMARHWKRSCVSLLIIINMCTLKQGKGVSSKRDVERRAS